MSISSYTTVTMLDSRPAQITISVPKSTDITNRIITFKDLYGSASISTITLVTRSGDTFEDGTFSTIMSNAYQTVNLYAGQPGKWLNIDGGSGGGGSSAGLTTVSNLLNAVSTNVTTISTNLNTVSNTVAAGRFPSISTNTISTSLIRAGYISSPQGYISSLIVDSLSFSLSNSFIVMGDIITTSVSTIQTFTSSLTTNNLRVGTVSTLNYIAFSGLQQGYAQTVIAEQATATGVQELLLFKGSTNTDRIRMQTTGPIVFEPGVSARVFPNTGSNATPAMIITTGSNVGIGVAAPTVALDVAGAGRFTAVSTNTISTNIVTGSVVGRLPANTLAASVSPLAVVNGNAYLSFSPQIEFQYNSGGYKHFMGSRHQGDTANSFGNAVDFWLYSATTGGSDASTTPGTCNVNTMSVTAQGVGIFNNSPSLALDVTGAGRFTAVSTNTISTNSIIAGDNLDLTATSINLHTSSIQQYLNYVPVSQPVIQFGSWSGPAAGSEGTWYSSETITITDYNNTNYCIYITGKNNSSLSPSYTAVPINGYSFSVYIGGGHQSYSNVFYWQTMGNYGASAGPETGNTAPE
jgi:hypothetical protein